MTKGLYCDLLLWSLLLQKQSIYKQQVYALQLPGT